MVLRDKFADKFGEKETEKLYMAALSHKEGLITEQGDDLFIWAILVVIDFQCVEIEDYRKYHEIKISYEDFKKFCIEHRKEILEYNGEPPSYLGLFCGAFNFLMEEEK